MIENEDKWSLKELLNIQVSDVTIKIIIICNLLCENDRQ